MSPSGILLPLLSAAYKASFTLLNALSNGISGGTTAHHAPLGKTQSLYRSTLLLDARVRWLSAIFRLSPQIYMNE